jgi:hypothetical protein
MVDSPEEGITRFCWKYIDPAAWDRKFTLLMDVTTSRYRIKSCEPMIPGISALLEQLDANGDFYGFLRKVRQGFVDLVRV